MIDTAIIISVSAGDNLVHFKQAIKSCLEQDHPCLILLARDGAVPAEVDIYLSELSDNSQMMVFMFDDKQGLACRLNFLIDEALKLSEVQFIARMDADDISRLDRVSCQIRFLDENPEVSIVGSAVDEIDSDSRFIKYCPVLTGNTEIMRSLPRRNPMKHPTVLFRKEIFKNGFRYDRGKIKAQDYYLWSDLVGANYIFANLSEPLVAYRVNDDFLSRRGVNLLMFEAGARWKAMKLLSAVNVKNCFFLFLFCVFRLSPKFIQRIGYRYLR